MEGKKAGENRLRLLRELPSVDELLRDERASSLLTAYPRSLVVDAVRQVLRELREALRGGVHGASPGIGSGAGAVGLAREALWAAIEDKCHRSTRRNLRRVVNATGVVLHTNLGRALLAPSAVEAVVEAASRYTNLELDLETGERGSRHDHVRDLLCRLSGAPSALVVNNNAAAVMLALDTLARGREVIVSRGQLVEIGGAFRLPAIMEKSGALLVEVGTTNKTYPADYEERIGERTALLLRVHRSNFRLVGFTRDVTLPELVEMGRRRGIPVMDDLGSGALLDLEEYGVPHEPTPQESLKAGADVVTFSGDKLLGGPQAGIILGRKEHLERMAKNPLARAVRADKLTLAALEATLRLYGDNARARQEIPALSMLTASPAALEKKARRLAGWIKAALGDRATVEVKEDRSPAGGGSLPGEELPTRVVVVEPYFAPVAHLQINLRRYDPPVLARLSQGRLVFDVRTLVDGDEAAIVRALRSEAGVVAGDW